MAYLTNRSVWISHINKQVVTFQIKVHNILTVKVLHSKRCIHRYKQSLTAVYSSGEEAKIDHQGMWKNV